ncbi:MAG: DUF3772 domain-containing protein [Kiloniellales bacterium]|nr:DUF3772 domain-containing protein [Kiloniellales bacterium]
MLRALLIPVLLAALLATDLPAFAQTAQDPAPAAQAAVAKNTPGTTADRPAASPAEEAAAKQLERWSRVLDRAEAQIAEGIRSLALLGSLEQRVDKVRKEVDEARRPLGLEVERIAGLIDALGPPPQEGEPPESAEVTAQRSALDQQKSVPEGRLKTLNVLFQRTNLLDGAIAEARVDLLKAQLLVRTPSLLSADTWGSAAGEFVELGARILASPTVWYQSPEVNEKVGAAYLAFATLAVLAAAVLGWYLRRWLSLSFGRRPGVEEPSYRMRVFAALAEATAMTAIPILVVVVAYGVLAGRGLLFGLFQDIMQGILAAVIWVSALRGLPRAMLSPSMPHWRLLRVGDLAARLWSRRAFELAVIIGVDQLITYPFRNLDPSLTLQYTYYFVADGALAAVFLAIVFDRRLWRTPEQEARAIRAGQPSSPALDDSAQRSSWWLAGRVLVGTLALAIPITGLAGYGVLSEHIASRLTASAGIFLVALVLHGLARDVVAVFTREDERPPDPGEKANPIYVWSVLLLDIGLVVTLVSFLVPLWGGRWENIFERIAWAMTGFTIGGRSFSLTDVLFGIVVFIILLALIRFIQRFLDVRVLQQTRMDAGVRNAVNTGIGYAGVLIAALIAIDTAGIDLSGLALIAGALSVGIGFGMQSVVSNFVSGLILLVERPIQVGDWIVVGQDQGYVKRISVRSTQIQTFSNASVIVPNSELIAGRVTNWMYKDRSGRVEIPIGVAYGSDTAKVRELLLQCAKSHSSVSARPQPNVMFMDFGDSALLFQLRFYIRDMDNYLSVASDLRFAIDAAFREAGIVIPFPQRDVHVIPASGPTDVAEAEPPSSQVLSMPTSPRTKESAEGQDGKK